jgi:hypothetical protein
MTVFIYGGVSDNQYNTIKNNLMGQVFEYLQDKNIILIHNAISDIIFNSSFDYTKILANNIKFSNKFFNDIFQQAKIKPITFTNKELLFYCSYLNCLNENLFNKFVVDNNGFLNQLILSIRNNKYLTSYTKNLANELYDKYLQLINPLIKDEFEKIFDDFNTEGLIFIPTGSNSNILLSKNYNVLYVCNDYVNKFLYNQDLSQNDFKLNWSDVLYYNGNKIESLYKLDLNNLFNIFQLFKENYNFHKHNFKILKLISSLNLEHYQKNFIEALNKNCMQIKYVNASEQNKLWDIFIKLFKINTSSLNNQCSYVKSDAKVLELKQELINDILTIYNFETKTKSEQGKLFLILSGIFARYSSASFFGVSDDSPRAIRYFAYGLMKAAYNLDNKIFSNNLFIDWTGRFLGIDNAFTCTSVLSSLIIEYCKKFNDYYTTYSGIIPIAWT